MKNSDASKSKRPSGNTGPSGVTTLRHPEAIAFLNSIKDPITRRLAHNAHFLALRRFTENRELPVANFDILFFAQVMEEFCSEHDLLKQYLAGETPGAWWDEE